jgi:hypothetical protein
MGRKVAVLWHALFSIAAGALYFFFVLPRWPELSYETSHTLGTAMRIVAGALIGLAALPVVFTWLRTRKPEYGTPQLALRLRLASVVLHVLAGVLIIGTAITEIWLTLDQAGRWLFGVYGAAAAVAVLGIFAFYLSFLAELPPPPPRPLKIKEPKQRRRRKGRKDEDADAAEEAAETEADEENPSESDDDDAADSGEDDSGEDEAGEDDASEDAESETSENEPAEVTAEDEPTEVKTDDEKPADDADGASADEGSRGLRNRRPLTARRRKRSRGGVAVDD